MQLSKGNNKTLKLGKGEHKLVKKEVKKNWIIIAKAVMLQFKVGEGQDVIKKQGDEMTIISVVLS